MGTRLVLGMRRKASLVRHDLDYQARLTSQ